MGIHQTTIDVSRIVRPRELAERLGVSLATIWRMRRRGEFPEPVRISPGCCGWSERTLAEWLKQRAEAGK